MTLWPPPAILSVDPPGGGGGGSGGSGWPGGSGDGSPGAIGSGPSSPPQPADVRIRSTTLVHQTHDALLFEAPEDEVAEASEIIEREMASAFEMDPPLGVDVGVGQNWLEAK